MTPLVVNGNGVYFAYPEDSEYREIGDSADLDAIVSDLLDGDDESLDDATTRSIKVSVLAAIATAAAEYLSAQVNGNFGGVPERAALVNLLATAGYGDAGQDDGLETHPGINA
jgi:hypothetical protein